MGRNTTPEKFARLVEAARATIPELAVTTDVIVGFPGESEAEFEESVAFVEAMQFADAHVFTYSERPGTAAARMPHPVQNRLRKQRNARLRAAVSESGAAFRRQFLGQQMDVLWEAETPLDADSLQVVGLTDNYLRVEAAAQASLWNQIAPARLTAVTAGGMRGSLASQRETVWFDS
jgi:threonylcarbamoyladenosine tRNA methylthiotransferase MtaB